uniref:1-acylglycerol-3-phosphate O-acyltransferase 3 n=1 Tax=Molossus molossus TaxID=27622 RepID=A0A7J8HYU1_MOLMO|nr:1-acylglycerol-3-phosphate O-acyltransferase 3 [Molossus molossus]
MGLLAYLKTQFILHLLIGFVFVVSGLVINFTQLCTLVLWPVNKQLYRRLNCRLAYSLWSQLVMLLEWWSCTECTLFTDQATMDCLGKEHVVIILNHNFEIDFLCGWTMCERFGVLGSSKVLAKRELLCVPLIGWTWYFLEIVFCNPSAGCWAGGHTEPVACAPATRSWGLRGTEDAGGRPLAHCPRTHECCSESNVSTPTPLSPKGGHRLLTQGLLASGDFIFTVDLLMSLSSLMKMRGGEPAPLPGPPSLLRAGTSVPEEGLPLTRWVASWPDGAHTHRCPAECLPRVSTACAWLCPLSTLSGLALERCVFRRWRCA